ncbi:hypothetical protein BX666DRAFT_1868742 [Dichotomocladium elegans]|nr:hypothetical protein BX666DRAFT_1868742 [Dichotomocladium elegans]
MTAEQKMRRKEQNRAAQRAFRERKERYVKELETKIKFMEETHSVSMQAVQRENMELRDVIRKMETELLSIKQPLQPPAKRIMRVPSSAVACIRDKDGVSFCERLKEEVCSSAYNQLLSEPLFDSAGFLLSDSIQHPVPIVTGDFDLRHDFDRFLKSMNDGVVIDPAKHANKLVSCKEVWQRLSEHPQFEHFDLNMLCDELKKCAKCSQDGPVLEEHELNQVIQKMESSVTP